MSPGFRCFAGALLLGPLLTALACQNKFTPKIDRRADPAAAASQLDNMQLASARRVALESAKAAIKNRDLPRLRQLSLWVRGRAQVPIFDADELQALDLAIVCLEHAPPPADALATLDAIQTGQLRKPARALCAAPAPE